MHDISSGQGAPGAHGEARISKKAKACFRVAVERSEAQSWCLDVDTHRERVVQRVRQAMHQ
eukprot:12920242-Prorocentrum_lima.AAC.1